MHWVDSTQKLKAAFGLGVTALCGARVSSSNMEPSNGSAPDCRECTRLYNGGRR